jgi:hypothetical protein
MRASGGRDFVPALAGFNALLAGANANCFGGAGRGFFFTLIGETLSIYQPATRRLNGETRWKKLRTDGAPALRFALDHEAARRHRPQGDHRKPPAAPPWGEHPGLGNPVRWDFRGLKNPQPTAP